LGEPLHGEGVTPYASRRMFVFDAESSENGTYWRWHAPPEPMTLAAVPAHLHPTLSLLRFPSAFHEHECVVVSARGLEPLLDEPFPGTP